MLKYGIDTRDISVVVQGAVESKLTKKCLKSIRHNLPEAEIILSTWKGSEIQQLDYDTLILNDDPGSLGWHYYYGERIVPVNFNRQLVSTKAGIQKATRKYVLKIRSDFYLKNNSFLSLYNDLNNRELPFHYFKNRVLIPSVYTRIFFPESAFPCPFCYSDFFFFGLREDVEDYFNMEPISQEEACNWHFKFPDRKPDRLETGRYMPEQFLGYAWAKRHRCECDFEDCSDWSLEKLELSNKVLFNNFICFDAGKHCLATKKHNLKSIEHSFGLVNEKLFLSENQKDFVLEQLIPFWKPKGKYKVKKILKSLTRSFL